MLDAITTYINRLTKAQLAALILLLFVVWCLIAWRWYVCGVRDLCSHHPLTHQVTVGFATAEATAPAEVVCAPILLYSIGFEGKNSTEDLRRLAHFFNVVQKERLALDGIFGPSDEAAVLHYQYRHGLPQTGSIDDTLKEMINREACEIFAQ